MRMTEVCLVLALAGCAAEPPKVEIVREAPIEIPTDLKEHCMSTFQLPPPPRLPRTPESVVKWAEAVRTAATKALIVCDRKREDLVGLIQGRNGETAMLTIP